MKHIIDKSFSFCYSHRVWSQELNPQFTDRGNNKCACRHLHGHEGLVKVFLEEIITGVNVNSTGFVTDFLNLGWFKNFIDDYLDHKMILDENDPLLPYEVPEIWSKGQTKLDETFLVHDIRGFTTVNLNIFVERLKLDLMHPMDRALIEKYNGLVFVNFVPTSENLAGWLLTVAAEKMKDIDNVRVSAVDYWETPRSHCRVEA
jgi:6-pyruvoyltetrahydropterin/6-carboxytetrahydropterin synthase